MKKLSVLACLLLVLYSAFLFACKDETAADAADKDTSYAFGMYMSSQLGLPEVKFDYDSFRDGFRDYNEAKETRITQEKAIEHINEIFMRLQFLGDGQTTVGDADKDTSYAFGMLMSSQLGLPEVRFNYNAFRDGFRDYNEARETRITQEKAIEHINNLFTKLQAASDAQASIEGENNREEGENFMAANKLRDNVYTTSSGLQYEVLVEGSGEKPGPEDTVQVHYEGTFIDGTVFDSSYDRGIPAEFPLYGVIKGWTEGLQLMNVGSTYRFVIPSDLAYGPYGQGSIPPSATLIFKVELLAILNY